MRIPTEKLARELERGLAPLYAVFGDEPLLALEATDRIRARARADGYGERTVLTAEQHFDWAQLAVGGQSQSLFAERRILELRIPSGKPGVEGGKALQEYCAHLPPDTVTLIQLSAVDWRGQKAAWFLALEAAGVMVEAAVVKRDRLPAWLAGRLQMQGQQAAEDALEFLADRVEGNLLAAYQEVQKLALLFAPGKLEFEQIERAVLNVARYDVYDLGEIVISGDAQRLSRVMEGLKGEGAAPPLVLWAITEEIRTLGRLLSLLRAGRPMPQALRDARIWGNARQALMQRHAPRHASPQVEAALVHAARIDRMVKGLVKGDIWDELLQLGLRFARQ